MKGKKITAQKRLQWMMGRRTNWCWITLVANKTIWWQTDQLKLWHLEHKKSGAAAATGVERWGEHSCTGATSSFRDADLFGAAAAAAPVEQHEAGGEREGPPDMIPKYNKRFHSVTPPLLQLLPMATLCVFVLKNCRSQICSFTLFIRERREIHSTSTTKK